MKDQDLQRLFEHFDAPSHAFQSIKHREAIADVTGQWPVLGEANEDVLDILGRVVRAGADKAIDAIDVGIVVDVPERLR